MRLYCGLCHSYWCPHVASHLYRPPFSRHDDVQGAKEEWEAEIARKNERKRRLQFESGTGPSDIAPSGE